MSVSKRVSSPARPHRINHEIRAQQVRLLSLEGEQLGILPLQQAMEEAQLAKMDLVEINPNAQPIVCRIMDYGKFLYERSKNMKQQKKRQKNVQLKEVKFRPTTDIGDYKLKLKQIFIFLDAGDKVKITVSFRGREIMHPEFGHQLLERIKEDVSEFAQVESYPSHTEGKQLIMLLAPKKKSG